MVYWEHRSCTICQRQLRRSNRQMGLPQTIRKAFLLCEASTADSMQAMHFCAIFAGKGPVRVYPLRGFALSRNGVQQKFTSPRVSRPSRALVVAATATATLERPPVEPPLPELPTMAKKIKVGINGVALPIILGTALSYLKSCNRLARQ